MVNLNTVILSWGATALTWVGFLEKINSLLVTLMALASLVLTLVYIYKALLEAKAIKQKMSSD